MSLKIRDEKGLIQALLAAVDASGAKGFVFSFYDQEEHIHVVDWPPDGNDIKRLSCVAMAFNNLSDRVKAQLNAVEELADSSQPDPLTNNRPKPTIIN